MKILFVSNGYPPRGRYGTEFYTKELVLGLRARGHEPFVLHPDRSGTQSRYTVQEVREDEVPVFLLHNQGDPAKRFGPSYADPRVDEAFAQVLERVRPDLVHFTYVLWGLSVGLPEVARAQGMPGVLTLTDYGLLCHRGQMFDWRGTRCFGPHPPGVCARCIREPTRYDAPPFQRGLRRIASHAAAALGGFGRVPTRAALEERSESVRAALGSLAAVVAPTRTLAEVFLAAGVPSEKLEEIVYAFDERPYAAVAGRSPSDPPSFGFLAQFAPHKGLATLLEAARLLDLRAPERSWKLLLYGAPPEGRGRLYAPSVLGRAHPDRVRTPAPFQPEEAPAVLAGLSALVLPSEWDENAPLSVLQARAIGLPVLGSDVPGIVEVLDPEASGTFPVGDAQALADRMEAVLTGRIGRSSRPGLPLGLEEHLAKIEALYTRILHRGR